MAIEKDENHGLDAFSWDEDQSFFGIEPGEETPPTPSKISDFLQDEDDEEEEDTPPVEKNKTKAKSKGKVKPEDEEEDEDEEEVEDEPKGKSKTKTDFFKDEEEDDDTPPQDKPEFYADLYKDMQTKGIFSNDLEEGEELDEESFFDKLDEEIEQRTQEGFEEFMEGLGNDGKAFLKYAKNGGTLRQFLAVSNISVDMPEVDIDTEDGQKIFMRYALKRDGFDTEEINDMIESLEEKGKLATTAKRRKDRFDAEDAQERETAAANLEQQTKEAKKAQLKFVSEMKTILNKPTNINGIAFNPKKDKELIDFITNPTVVLANKKYATPLQVKLAEVFKDPEKVLLLGKLLKTDFDLSSVEKEAESTVTRKVKTSLSRLKEGNTKAAASSSTGNRGRSLADLLD